MREFEEQFRGKLDDEEDEDEDELEDEEETEKAGGNADEAETKVEGGELESPKRMKKQKSSLKRQKSSRGKLNKARSRVLSAKEYENLDLDQMKQDEQNEGGEDKNEAGNTPTDYRDRRRAIAVSRNNSVRRVGSFRGQGNANSPTASGPIPQATTVATLRKQMRSGSVMVSPTNKALTTIASNDEGSLKEYDDFDDNSSIETAPNATTTDESPGDILAEVSRRKTKSRTRKSTGMTLTSGRNSKRISNARKRRSVAADNTRYGDDDEPSLPKLIDPEILMKLNQRENLFGVPNEKVTLQRMESLRRRRSIPRDFVYYELKKAPVAIEEIATEIVAATGDGTVTTANTEIVPALPPLDKKAQRRLDRNFTLYTREILTNTKGRIENIKSMLQETPPTTARSLRSAGGGGGGGVGEKRRRKTKRNDAVIEDSDLDQEEEEREQPTEEVKNRKSSNAYLSKKPPSANGKKDAARTTKVGIPQVELTPPPENAGKFELALRQGLLTVIRNTKGMNENFTHTVVNGITPFIHTVATEVTDLFNSLWQSVYANKTSLDFFEKLSTVFQGIMSLMTPDATTVQLADVCAQVVPLAGSTLNASVTQQWQEAVQIDEEVLLSLLPTVVNYGTGERRNKSLNEFMEDKIHIYPYNPKIATAIDKKDPNNPNLNSEGIDETIYQYFPKFQQLKSSIQKMHDQTQFMNTTLSEYFIEVLRDWSSAKTVFLELDKRLENEREKARKPLDMKLLTISKELNKMTALYEKNMELMRNLEIKLKEYEKYEAELKRCELKLIDTQAQLEVLMTEHSELSKEHQLLVEKKEKLSKEIESYEELVERLYKEIADHKSEITQLKDKIRSLEGSLQVMTDDRDEVQVKSFCIFLFFCEGSLRIDLM